MRTERVSRDAHALRAGAAFVGAICVAVVLSMWAIGTARAGGCGALAGMIEEGQGEAAVNFPSGCVYREEAAPTEEAGTLDDSNDETATLNRGSAEEEGVECDKYASLDGLDGAEGSESEPFQTAQHLVDSLEPGETGCLRAGTYTETDAEVRFESGGTSGGDRVTLRSYPGETAEFRGSIHVPEGSDYVTVSNMRLDGSYGPLTTDKYKKGESVGNKHTRPAVWVRADDVNVLDNDISNRRPNGDPDLAGQGILVSSGTSTADNVLIKGNRIHDSGQLPRNNHEHGIYASDLGNGVIQDNLIYANADRGVQLYPGAQGSQVEGNVFDGNATNLAINEDSSQNTVRGNVFSDPADGWNVILGPKLSGSGNRVIDNCFWAPSGEMAFKDGGKNTSVSGNVTADPGYQKQDNFEITNPDCLAKYSGALAEAPASDASNDASAEDADPAHPAATLEIAPEETLPEPAATPEPQTKPETTPYVTPEQPVASEPSEETCQGARVVMSGSGYGKGETPAFPTEGSRLKLAVKPEGDPPLGEPVSVTLVGEGGSKATLEQDATRLAPYIVPAGPGRYVVQIDSGAVPYRLTVEDCPVEEAGDAKNSPSPTATLLP